MKRENERDALPLTGAPDPPGATGRSCWFRRLAAALLVAIAASAFGVPALAQMHNGSNSPPAFSADTADRSVAENTAANTNIGEPIPEAMDPDGDTVTYTVVEGGDLYSFRAFGFDPSTRQLKTLDPLETLDPLDFERGSSYSLRVMATDTAGASDTIYVNITVTDVNESPVVGIGAPSQGTNAGHAFSYTFPATTFSDEDGDTLTYTATKEHGAALPSWLTFTAATRTFSGTPASVDVGTVSVKVTASDNMFPVSDVFSIRVHPSVACSRPELAGRTEIWTNTITVGATNETPPAYGYDGISDPVVGSLAGHNLFNDALGMRRQAVKGITLTSEGTLALTTSAALLPDFQEGNAELDICNRTFRLRDATPTSVSSGAKYSWTNTGLTWAENDPVRVALFLRPWPAPTMLVLEAPSGTAGMLRATWQPPGDTHSVEAYHVRYRIVGSNPSGASFQRAEGLDEPELFIRYLLPNTTYEVQVCTVIGRSPSGYDRRGGCSGWSRIRLPARNAANANNIVLSLEYPDGGSKVTLAAGEPVTYRIRIRGVHDTSGLDFGTSTIGSMQVRVKPRDVDWSYSGSVFGIAREFIVWDGLTEGYWDRTTALPAKAEPYGPIWVEALRDTYGSGPVTPIGTQNSLCVEIKDSTNTVNHPCPGAQVEVDPPTVDGAPAVSEAGADGHWTEGETVEVTVAFSEAVEVDTATGVPSVGLELGGPTQTRSAAYLRGSGTAELVFGYTLVDGDGAHTVMAVTPDSLALNDGAIRSVATGADAALGHAGTLVLASPPSIPDGPKARFEGLPEQHNGATAFTVELQFSAEPAGLSYRTVQGGLQVQGGTVTRAARRTPGSNRGWRVTVAPGGDGDVQIRLPVRPCDQPNAICVGGEPLAQAAEATVPGASATAPPPEVPFTASFSGAPAEHDGTSLFELEFRLSAEPAGLSYRTVQSGLFDVSGGTIGRAWRLQKGNDAGWGLRIEPSGFGDVTLALRATTDCAGTPGICTSDGRMLPGGLEATIGGPPTLAVADAEVEEASGAVLAFTVTLSRALTETVTVDYRTEDGTASAGADYTQTTGSLTFTAGETAKTVAVPVLDDVHDDDGETLTLRLQTPSPVRVKLSDGEATGTIHNSDPLLQAWLSRFGRTVGTHVVDAVGTRLRGAPGVESHVTVGGYRLPLEKPIAGEPAATTPEGASERALAARLWGPLPGGPSPGAEPDGRLAALVRGLAGVLGVGRAPTGGADAAGAWAEQPAGDPRLGQSQPLHVPALRQVLVGSSFRLHVSGDPRDAATPRLTAWGQFAGTTFDGRDGTLTLGGDVLTGTVGVDSEWDHWLAGVAVAHSRGDGGYTTAGLDEHGQGDLASTLTSLHPYLRYAVNERLDVWGVLGYGWGELEMKQDSGETRATDTTLVLGAFGGRGLLLTAADTGGVQLATRTDAMLTRTSSEAVAGLQASDADAHRVRVILEGSREFAWAEGRRLTPTVEVGLRHDWGDAETGFGLELGGRVQYADPALGLTIEAAVRGLLAHEDSDYGEWGASGSLRLAPGLDGQGLALTLSPTWGAASSGVDGLWTRQTAAGLAPPGTRSAPTGSLNAEVSYGVAAPFGTGLLTPYAGTVLTDGAARTYRLGTRWTSVSGLALSLEGQRQEPVGPQPINQGLQFQAAWGF